MMKLLIAASLGWLAVGQYETLKDGSRCDMNGYTKITDAATCQTEMMNRGFGNSFQQINNGMFPEGCSSDGNNAYFNEHRGSYCGRMNIFCLCYAPIEDKVCNNVMKKKTCKALSYCNYDRQCKDVTPGAKIPIKEFCEIIPTRGWCKRTVGCMWGGDKCMLKSEAVCGDISKRRICTKFRAKNDGCLNGARCVWVGTKCLE